MPVIIVLIVILGIGIGVFTYFLIRSIIAPKQIDTLFKQMEQGKSAAVARTAKQILTKQPRSVDAHYLLAKAYLNQDKPELALMELKTVNEIGIFEGHTKEAEFRKTIAELFQRFKQSDEALKEYLLLIKLEPSVAEHYFKAGELFEQRNRTDKAANFYRKTIELAPKHSMALYRLGYVLYRNKKPVEAKKYFEAALRADPENYKAHFYMGKILKENHDHVAALVSFEKAQRDQELKTRALIERGSCYMNMKDFEKASTELERAIKLSEGDNSQEILYARYFLSLAYENTRNYDEAIKQWEIIYKKKPSFKDVADKLSQYQEIRTDDHIKDYLTVGSSEFGELCKAMTTQVMELQPQDISEINNGIQIVAVDNTSKWRNAKKQPKLLWFIRVPEVLSDSTIRSLHEKMKKLNVSRGVVVSSSGFTRQAIDYTESRPIDLIDKEKLQKVLSKVDFDKL
ncbi:MAG: tetratricopeptide repeat protein [Spirochaetaceae bacterium]